MADAIIRSKRKIVYIDEEKCNGCGLCIISCAEGALKIIDGKAKLIRDKYCDGLGACLCECPQGAITIEEREAEEFDEAAVEHHLVEKQKAEATLPCGCPSTAVTEFEERKSKGIAHDQDSQQESTLTHWPVQLRLVPATAAFLQGADLLLTADCVPFTFANFHSELLKDHAVLVACPKLDDLNTHLDKLTQILSQSNPNSLTVLHMEVPCCSGLMYLAKEAIKASGKDIPLEEVTISVKGDRLPDRQKQKLPL
ncbi:ATP-binding protein [Chloroflexota bacterium]